MKLPLPFAALLLALPFAATAQTTPPKTTTPPATTTKTTSDAQQVTEVTEELDPATGKVIRRTTRTTTLPAGTALPGTAGTPSADTNDAGTAASMADARGTDAQVSAFLREKITVRTLTAPRLLSAYNRFIDKVRDERHTWKPADWAMAAAVMSSLNDRYEQLRTGYSLDDKLTIRSQQAEFQALRTARQISTQVSDKL